MGMYIIRLLLSISSRYVDMSHIAKRFFYIKCAKTLKAAEKNHRQYFETLHGNLERK